MLAALTRLWTSLTGSQSGDPRARVGQMGEQLAVGHLKAQRYRVLGRNLHVPMGEADILALAPDKQTIVLVEVRSRISDGTALSTPETSIDAEKRDKLSTILNHLVRANAWKARSTRIDVIAVEFSGSDLRQHAIRHHQRAVRTST